MLLGLPKVVKTWVCESTVLFWKHWTGKTVKTCRWINLQYSLHLVISTLFYTCNHKIACLLCSLRGSLSPCFFASMRILGNCHKYSAFATANKKSVGTIIGTFLHLFRNVVFMLFEHAVSTCLFLPFTCLLLADSTCLFYLPFRQLYIFNINHGHFFTCSPHENRINISLILFFHVRLQNVAFAMFAIHAIRVNDVYHPPINPILLQ